MLQVRFHTALLVVSPVVRWREWEWACLAGIGDAVRQQILTRQESGGGCLGGWWLSWTLRARCRVVLREPAVHGRRRSEKM